VWAEEEGLEGRLEGGCKEGLAGGVLHYCSVCTWLVVLNGGREGRGTCQ
jgi:hypothetical protein